MTLVLFVAVGGEMVICGCMATAVIIPERRYSTHLQTLHEDRHPEPAIC